MLWVRENVNVFDRLASLELPPGQWERAWTSLSRRDVLGRMALALLAATTICVVIRGWEPPFPYRTAYTPLRDIVASVAFTKADPAATQAAQQRARDQARHVYVQDRQAAGAIRAKLRNTLVELTAVATLDKVDPKVWKDFQRAAGGCGNAAQRPSNSQPHSRRSSSACFAQLVHAAGTPGSRGESRGRGLVVPSSSAGCWISSIPSWARETRKRSLPIRSASPEATRCSASATC